MKPFESLRPRLQAVFNHYDVGAAAFALRHGEQTWLYLHGCQATQAFNVASLAKAFCAVLCAKIVGSGRITWDEPVAPHLPELGFSDAITAQITLRDLLSNRLGLEVQYPLEEALGAHIPLPEVLRRWRFVPPIGEFRQCFSYSNLGFVAVTLLLERLTDIPYAELLHREVLVPLGMKHSASAALGLEATMRGFDRVWFTQTPFDNHQGAGWMYLAPQDALAWLGYWLDRPDPSLLEPQVAVPNGGLWMGVPDSSLAYGFGWAHSQFYGQPMLQHSGATLGASAHISLLPQAKLGAVCMVAGGDLYRAALIYEVFERLLLGQASRDWLALGDAELCSLLEQTKSSSQAEHPHQLGEPCPMPLEALCGLYSSQTSGSASIRLFGTRLQLSFSDAPHWTCWLIHSGGLVFAVERQTRDFGVRFMDATPFGRFEPRSTGFAFLHNAFGCLESVL